MNVSLLFIGIKGTVLALDRATGREVWRTRVKGSDFINVVLDGGGLYATTQGEIFALDPATGEVLWHNKLEGLGLGLVSIASSSPAGTVVTGEEQRRRELVDSSIVAG